MSNSNNRRDFLKKSAVLFAGISTTNLGLASLTTSCKNEKKSNSSPTHSRKLAIRKNIADLELNDPEFKLFKDAVSILKKRSKIMPLDPMGWDAHGVLHSVFCASSIYTNQVHYSWFVWPWHRLYLWSMEQKLQQAVGEPKLALPYWDWTKNNFIPEHYWGGESNPLYNPTREVGAGDKIPEDFINVGAAFRASKYATFGGYPTIKKKGESQRDGIAEQTFHNNIHNWIGGQMATFSESGYDPVFYAHHGNCDRIWEAWKQYHPGNLYPADEEWLNKKMYSTDGNGRPIEFKVRELLNTQQLGYTFADLDFNPAFSNPLEESMQPQRKKSEGDRIAPLKIDTVSTSAIFYEDNRNDRAHIMLHFDRAELPYHPYCARLFFEYTLNGVEKSSYSGTFTILPILDMDSFILQNGVTLQVEVIAEVIQAIQNKSSIQVVFQPVPLPNRSIPDKPLRLSEIRLETNTSSQ
jgi:hypothetical protein